MQHPDYRKPVQFKTVHSFVPPTPNLEEIKRINMKLKIQKAPQPEIQILTPRSTRNLHSETDKKKSFRNLSLVLDCENDHSTHYFETKNYQTNNQLKEKSQNSSNHPVFSQANHNEGKQNISVGQFNMNMKKRSKQSNNIEFKQVKSTKNKRSTQQIQPKEPFHDKNIPKQSNMNRNDQAKYSGSTGVENQVHPSNGVSYGKQFESLTYQIQYKASTLGAFNDSLYDFSAFVSQAQKQLQDDFVLHEQFLFETINDINEQFGLITEKISEIHQSAIKETTERLMKLKSEHKSGIKQLQEICKSISRYQADINLHYDDIVKELEFSCFEDIMSKYQKKMEYFDQQLNWIVQRKYEKPNEMFAWKKLVRFIQKLDMNPKKEPNGAFGAQINQNITAYRDQILEEEQTSSRRAG